MAKISTRQAATTTEEKAIYDRLLEIVEQGTGGAISNTPLGLITPSADVFGLLDDLEHVFETMNSVGRTMLVELAVLGHENMVLHVKCAEAIDLLDKFMDVSYDESLDHATADMMDAFVGSGVAEADTQGELQFDSRVTVGRGDLKPILREAILRWVEMKLQ